MLDCIPFKPDHLDLLVAREHEKEEILDNPFAKESLKDAFNSDDIETWVKDGRIISIVCCQKFWEGTADIWQIPSIYVKDYALSYVKTFRKRMNYLKENKITRLQSTCLDDELHNKWMESCGFKSESVLRKFRNGNDYRTWVMFFEE